MVKYMHIETLFILLIVKPNVKRTLMQVLEKEIIRKAATGDIVAFEKIYRETSSFVYSVAFRVMGNKEEAEEVSQDVFMKIHDHLKDFNFESSLKTWIYRITVNTAINTIKRKIADRTKTEKFEKEKAQMVSYQPVVQNMEQEHAELKVQELLALLNPDQKVCIILREIEGMSYEEIAQTLKINLNTVRSRLKRARAILLKKAMTKGVERT
jgi:RNA polymerase sigma-70 factor, ECF subfamily